MSPRRPPRAAWGAFPLSELCVLAGVLLSVAGFARLLGPSAEIVALGATLAGAGALELALREHLAGHGPSAGAIAGFCAVAVLAALALGARVAPPVALAAAVTGGLAAAAALRCAARRRNP